MKIICIENTHDSELSYLTVRSDSSVLRNNDNFYMPNFSQKMECSVGYYLRVTRLAKCINSKFASRCYDTVGVAAAFTAQDVVERNCARGLPCDEAYCFDKSIALSPDTVTPDTIGEGTLKIAIGEILSAEISVDELHKLLDSALTQASVLTTLKTGDIVYIAVKGPIPVAIGNSVEVQLNGAKMLNFEIR